MKKYFIKTFGCQANKADSERITGWYEARGWQKAETISEADEVVINTCSVRQSAEDRVFGLVRSLEEATRNTQHATRIILTGCMLYHPLKWLKEKLPEVDEFKKIQEFEINPQFDNLIIRNSQIHAWVPIMEGCSHFCTYCVVPYARGEERSRPFEEIIREVKELAKRGYREITLLGQNVNAYGKDFSCQELRKICSCLNNSNHLSKKKANPFALLLRKLHQIEGIKKISFITSNPWDLRDDIIEAMSLSKIDRYFHLPVQSGDDEILKKMNRPYTAREYIKLVEKIRKNIPDIKIGTDIIVGFPGETKKQFENTVKLCKKVGFEKGYIAIYSPRPGTAAYKLEDDVPYKEKKRRWKVLDELINQ